MADKDPPILTLASFGVRPCTEDIKYSVPYELTEEYAKVRTLQERFEAVNEYRAFIGMPPLTYEEYLEWRKT
jgi:hypothetical protein